MWYEPKTPVEKELFDMDRRIEELRTQRNGIIEKLELELIENYQLKNLDGTATELKKLFGEKDEMLLIHNMGPSCPYCTLWADGLKGFAPYLQDRCALVLETDKNVEELYKFSQTRGWNYTVVSSAGSELKTDLFFKTEKGNMPGVSSLILKDDKVYRKTRTYFGPGDDYCSLWHYLDLLPNGVNNWQPSYQ